jgi:hypothetical protein
MRLFGKDLYRKKRGKDGWGSDADDVKSQEGLMIRG